eukprot:2085756-Pleurochrysis_carterae.AAC.3
MPKWQPARAAQSSKQAEAAHNSHTPVNDSTRSSHSGFTRILDARAFDSRAQQCVCCAHAPTARPESAWARRDPPDIWLTVRRTFQRECGKESSSACPACKRFMRRRALPRGALRNHAQGDLDFRTLAGSRRLGRDPARVRTSRLKSDLLAECSHVGGEAIPRPKARLPRSQANALATHRLPRAGSARLAPRSLLTRQQRAEMPSG